jgi:hypothetical protein
MRILATSLIAMATLCLVLAGATTARAEYYVDGFYGYGGYGPFYDCDGANHRCYIGPPYVAHRYHGRVYRAPGLYYFGEGGGYFHRWYW